MSKTVRLSSAQDLLVTLGEKVEAALTQKPIVIEKVVYTDNSYNPLPDLAHIPNVASKIILQGTGFSPVCTLKITDSSNQVVNPTSVEWVSDTQYKIQLGPLTPGSYTIYIYRPDATEFTLVDGLVISSYPVWVSSSTLPAAQRAIPYTTTLNANEVDGSAIIYSEVTPVPPGLTLLADGTLSGTITEFYSRTYSFTAKATDAQNQSIQRTFTIQYTDPEPVWVTGTDLGVVVYNKPWSFTLSATESSGSSITYSIVSGLPAEAVFDPVTATISGLMVADGQIDYTITARATDEQGQTADRVFKLKYVGTVYATGGSIGTWTDPSTGATYRYHVFNSNGTWYNEGKGGNVDVLLVGGGGASGVSKVYSTTQIAVPPYVLTRSIGGGGGGGGQVRDVYNISVSTGQSVSISVGAGGDPATSGNGGTTSAFGYSAGGGGGGGGALDPNGKTGASGGGGAGAVGGATPGSGGGATAGYGGGGGQSGTIYPYGGGGGGAGGGGAFAMQVAGTQYGSGYGGKGRTLTFIGQQTFASGGNGYNVNWSGTNPMGSAGSGGTSYSEGTAGPGQRGVVYIRYRI